MESANKNLRDISDQRIKTVDANIANAHSLPKDKNVDDYGRITEILKNQKQARNLRKKLYKDIVASFKILMFGVTLLIITWFAVGVKRGDNPIIPIPVVVAYISTLTVQFFSVIIVIAKSIFPGNGK